MLRRALSSTVEVVMAEREPVALGRLGRELYLVDGEGVVMDAFGPQYANLDLPIVDGLARSSAGSTADPSRAELAARVISSLRLRPELARRLSQVDVTNVRNAAVILDGDPAVVYVGDDRFLERLESYVQLAPTLRERVPDIDYVDLRFDGRVYVKPAARPAAGANTSQAGTPGKPAGIRR